MNNTLRIRTQPSDQQNYIKIKLDQSFDFLNVLSLTLSEEDIYRQFDADYGAIIGRVTVNSSGFGIPNAKVSIFIPITDADAADSVISALYPYKVVTDKNADGIRYNLLPDQQNDYNPCHKAVGTYASKREILDNDTMLYVYDTYYQFVTTTNHAGDYMLFGVPTGNQTIHFDVDLSDIGVVSQKPYDMIRQGYPANKFSSPAQFNQDKNLDNLPNIITRNTTVNVIPFWGSSVEVGINRLDFDLPYTITPAAFFIGSIFGDSEKNSVNKNCRARKDLGYICDQVTGEGTIEMLQVMSDGTVSDNTINGGQLIDEDGTWVFQVPMTQNYMVTDEFGNLIPTQDTSKGIPTSTQVRFKIAMNETAGEGRLRTRASYIVPNNPPISIQPNYNFDSSVPINDNNFYKMKWNKLYTVRNYISRVQPNATLAAADRHFTGIKKVDDCSNYTLFPYNRIEVADNPLYLVLCIILGIILTIVTTINFTVIWALNLAISLINDVISLMCNVINVINSVSSLIGVSIPCYPSSCNCNMSGCNPSGGISSISCISILCNGYYYAPGCQSHCGQLGVSTPLATGAFDNCWGVNTCAASKCLESELAEALDVFKLDFYNDWINGTLYAYLLKYKRKDKSSADYCDNTLSYGIEVIDTCGYDHSSSSPITMTNGLIIRNSNDNHLYYASASPQGVKLYATSITCLGSVSDYDVDGYPKLYEFIPHTTYMIPPLIAEVDGSEIVAGMMNDGNGNAGMFGDISCINISVSPKNCINLRLQSEIGRTLSSTATGGPSALLNIASANSLWPYNTQPNDDTISGNTYIRNQIVILNTTGTSITNLYEEFRGFNGLGYGDPYYNYSSYPYFPNSGLPTNNSYYFYFGLIPGRTAIEKLLNNYLLDCVYNPPAEFLIMYTSVAQTSTSIHNGSINLIFVGGSPNFTISWTGPISSTLPVISTTNTYLISHLITGTYNITVTDSIGMTERINIYVGGPVPIQFTVISTSVTYYGGNNGTIGVYAIAGGIAPYTLKIDKITGRPPFLIHHTIASYSGLAVGASESLPTLLAGTYEIMVTDSSSPVQISSQQIIITQPQPLVLSIITSASTLNLECYGNTDGSIVYNMAGGTPPYSINFNGTTSTTFTYGGLIAGTYWAQLTDSSTPVETTSIIYTTITQPSAPLTVTGYMVNPATLLPTGSTYVSAVGGTTPYTYFISPAPTTGHDTQGPVSGPVTFTNLAVNPYEVTVTDINGCIAHVQVVITT